MRQVSLLKSLQVDGHCFQESLYPLVKVTRDSEQGKRDQWELTQVQRIDRDKVRTDSLANSRYALFASGTWILPLTAHFPPGMTWRDVSIFAFRINSSPCLSSCSLYRVIIVLQDDRTSPCEGVRESETSLKRVGGENILLVSLVPATMQANSWHEF